MAGPSLSSLTASFDQDCNYVTSYLFSPHILAGLRLLLGTYSLVSNIVILVWSGVVLHDEYFDGYFSYFNHLSYIGLIAWFWASGTQTAVFARASKDGRPSHYPLQSWHRGLQVLHELLFVTIATYPVIVTTFHWTLVAYGNTFATPFRAWENTTLHVLNTPFALFEIFCTNVPALRWIYLPITMIFLGLYLGVVYITHASQGFYVYDFLDPQKQGALLAGYIFGIAAGQAIVFILVRYVIVVREYLVRGKSEKNAAVEVPDGHVMVGEVVIGRFKV